MEHKDKLSLNKANGNKHFVKITKCSESGVWYEHLVGEVVQIKYKWWKENKQYRISSKDKHFKALNRGLNVDIPNEVFELDDVEYLGIL